LFLVAVSFIHFRSIFIPTWMAHKFAYMLILLDIKFKESCSYYLNAGMGFLNTV
jgi:hypothetical protein